MSSSEYKPRRLFTLEEANARLPLVRMIVADLIDAGVQLVERRKRLQKLANGRELSAGDVYSDELLAIQSELESDADRVRSLNQELIDLGVEPKGPLEGLVDFPSIIDGRVVFLCWRHGEAEISYWHDVDDGFAGRQPLFVGATKDDSSEPDSA